MMGRPSYLCHLPSDEGKMAGEVRSVEQSKGQGGSRSNNNDVGRIPLAGVSSFFFSPQTYPSKITSKGMRRPIICRKLMQG